MFTLPSVLACLLPLAQGVAEGMAMVQTEATRRRWRPEWTFFAVNIPYWLLIIGGVAQHLNQSTRPHAWALFVGTSLAALGIVLRVVAHYHLRDSFSPFVELGERHRLVTMGLYRGLRHPMYLGTLFIFIGLPLLLGSTFAAAMGVLGSLALVARIRKEEHLLRERLEGFVDYANRTWGLVPGVW